MPLLSIIVPVYNSEKYLKSTINSILNQNFSDFELILVNDGSTDNSSNICETFKNNNQKIHVINQENLGVSEARNAGIKAASGKYIQFVDSDDFIQPEMSKTLITQMESHNADMVICGYFKFDQNNQSKVISMPDKIYSSIKDFSNDIMLFSKFWLLNTPTNKLYCTKIIKEHNIYFDHNFNLGEDLLFNCEYLKHSNLIINLQEPLYNYVCNVNSLTHKEHKDFYENQKTIYTQLRNLILYFNMFNGSLKQDFYTFYLNNVIIYIIEKISIENISITKKVHQINQIIKESITEEALKYGTADSMFYNLIFFLLKHKYIHTIIFVSNIKKLILKLIYKK